MSLPRLLLPLALLLTPLTLCAADGPPPPDLSTPPEVVSSARLAALPPHPRLLATAADFARLRAQLRSDPETAEIHALLVRRAEILLAAPPVNYAADPSNILVAVRDAQRRILTFALLHRLGEDPRYLEAIRRVVAPLIAEPWTGVHFLDTAEAAFTLALVYDWLHAELRPDELDAIAAKVHREALLASVTDEHRLGWLWAAHNWNQVCHGGLVTAALVLAERHPDLSRHIINRSIAQLPRAAAAYAPVGVYPEGPSYWNYGTSFHLLQLEAYRSALGESLGLERFPGFLETAAALDQITGPSDEYFNHSDNRLRRIYSAASLWFARENRQPALARAELARMRRQALVIEPDDSRDLPLSLLWWRPLPPAEGAAAAPRASLAWVGQGIQPVAVLRSSWDDPRATWLALKGGTAGHSHAHMDAGSFVLEALGVRWAVDLERDNYQSLRNAGYAHSDIFGLTQSSKRWAVFRLGSEGHNILRFDRAPQLVSGRATIGPLVTDASGSSVEVDLTSTYAGQAAAARRRATLHPDASVTIADTWTTLATPAEVSWQWLTPARVTRTAEGLLLEHRDVALRLRINASDTYSATIEPVDTLLTPGLDSPAPGHNRIVLRLRGPAHATGFLTVQAVPVIDRRDAPPALRDP